MLDSEEDKEDNEDHGQDDGDDHHHPAVNHATFPLFHIADYYPVLYPGFSFCLCVCYGHPLQ